ncbi:protodermal factor 1 [Manihot esculenta]|uniref:Protodermal factor 1 n=1 Tax=Manihot esculenta TaxID=3983 RepID=A0A2C9WKD7_MANES|nr:protodermal factor 1 [Manihot esculenta]OAY60644.1 hypothetical protein MANES_01G128300v8 [Manihot esculenta]
MGMGKCKHTSMLMLVLVAGLLCQNFAIVPVTARTIEDDKHYYPSPDPHARSPPTGSHSTPHHGGGSTPHHGGGSTPSHGGGYGGTPPSHPTPSTPSPGNCGTPPSVPTPSRPPSDPTPTPYTPTPSTPPSVPTPSTPSNPPPSGGGYYPTPPSTGGSPPTPVIETPPTPITPTPSTPYIPSPPFIPDPNSPFTCTYWKNHPGIIWGLLGWWGTVGSAFGATSFSGFGASMSLPQALSNTRNDGYGTLYREGTASLLNSMVSNRFPFTTTQVRDSFVTALASNKAAAAQGSLFKLANEGKLKPRN